MKRYIYLISCSSLLAFSGMFSVCRADDNCLKPEEVHDPDLTKIEGGIEFEQSLNTQYGKIRLREIRYDFTPGNDDGDDVVFVKEQFSLDFSDVKKGIEAEAYKQANDAQSCSASISASNFHLEPSATGDLFGSIDLDTTFRACQIFDLPCIRNWKVTTCRNEWKEDIDRHVFGVNIGIRRIFYTDAAYQDAVKVISSQTSLGGMVDEISIASRASELLCSGTHPLARPDENGERKNVKFCGRSDFDERGYSVTSGVRNFVLNLVGIATLNIGSKFILDTSRSKLSQTHALIDKTFRADLPKRSSLVGESMAQKLFLNNLSFMQDLTKFTYNEPPEGRYLAFNHVSSHTSSGGIRKKTFCRLVRPVIAQYGALFRSTTQGDKEIPVSRESSSLWRIATTNYGSGYYFVTLLEPNKLPFRNADKLKFRSTVKLPAMYKIWSGPAQVVKPGDSLWSIAKQKSGDGMEYRKLYDIQPEYIQSPSKIYPAQLLRLN